MTTQHEPSGFGENQRGNAGSVGEEDARKRPTVRRVGRPRVTVASSEVHRLRAAGLSWRQISRQLIADMETARRSGGGSRPTTSPAASPTPSQETGLAIIPAARTPSPFGHRHTVFGIRPSTAPRISEVI